MYDASPPVALLISARLECRCEMRRCFRSAGGLDPEMTASSFQASMELSSWTSLGEPSRGFIRQDKTHGRIVRTEPRMIYCSTNAADRYDQGSETGMETNPRVQAAQALAVHAACARAPAAPAPRSQPRLGVRTRTEGQANLDSVFAPVARLFQSALPTFPPCHTECSTQ